MSAIRIRRGFAAAVVALAERTEVRMAYNDIVLLDQFEYAGAD